MSFPPPTERQGKVLWFSLTATAVAILLGLMGALVWGLGFALSRLSAVLMPVAIAMVLAYILDPVVEYFVRKRLPRVWSILLVFILGLGIFSAVVGSVIPGIIEESRKLVEDLPRNTRVLRDKMEDFLDNSPIGRQLPQSWHSMARTVPGSARKSASATNETGGTNVFSMAATEGGGTNSAAGTGPGGAVPAEGVDESLIAGLSKALMVILKWMTAQLSNVTTWVEFLIGFILVPVYLFYFLLEKKGINERWTDYLPIHESKAKEELVFVLKSINECMIVFFRGQVLVALCVGTLLTIGYLFLGLNYAVLLGLVAAVLGIVPYLGTVTSLVLALAVAAIQFGDWTHPWIVLGIVACVKLLEDLVISPKIIGERSGLHPLTVILAVMIGANLLGGFLGALVAIPVTAVLRTLMFRYVWKRRERVPENGVPDSP